MEKVKSLVKTGSNKNYQQLPKAAGGSGYSDLESRMPDAGSVVGDVVVRVEQDEPPSNGGSRNVWEQMARTESLKGAGQVQEASGTAVEGSEAGPWPWRRLKEGGASSPQRSRELSSPGRRSHLSVSPPTQADRSVRVHFSEGGEGKAQESAPPDPEASEKPLLQDSSYGLVRDVVDVQSVPTPKLVNEGPSTILEVSSALPDEKFEAGRPSLESRRPSTARSSYSLNRSEGSPHHARSSSSPTDGSAKVSGILPPSGAATPVHGSARASPGFEHHTGPPAYSDPVFLSSSEMRDIARRRLRGVIDPETHSGPRASVDAPGLEMHPLQGNGRGQSPNDHISSASVSVTEVGRLSSARHAFFSGELVRPGVKDGSGVVKSPRSGSRPLSRNMSRLRSRSRLGDDYGKPPLPPSSRPASRQPSPAHRLSGLRSPQKDLPKVMEEEEEDPFKDADFPEKYRKRVGCKFLTIFQWNAFVLLMGGLICSLTIPRLKNWARLGHQLWKWVLMVLVIFCGRLISGWLIKVVVFLLEKNFLLRKKVLYFVYGLRKGVQNCIWIVWVIIAWHLIFEQEVEKSRRSDARVLKYVTQVLECLLLAAAIILVKIFLVKLLASNFHVSTYFDRIQDTLFNQYVLETLSGPPWVEVEFEEEVKKIQAESKLSNRNVDYVPDSNPTPPKGHEGAAAKKMGAEEDKIDVKHLQKLDRKNVSAWNMKRMVNLVIHSGMSSISETVDDTSAEAGQDTEIRSEWQAKAAAKHIFRNVAKPDSKVIEEDDLLRFMNQETVDRTFPLFDGASDTGNISKKALKSWVINVYKERQALAYSLNDTKTAVKKLSRIIDVMMAIVVLVLWLLVLGVTTTHLLLFLSSQVLVVVFVFGNTCKTIFEAIIFLFVMHPFDVGDRCIVDGVQLVVEEMNIMTTVFLKLDNEKVWYPNSVLCTKPISNLFRSPDMMDSTDFQIDVATPTEKIQALREKMTAYIKSLPHFWKEKLSINVKEIQNMNKMTLQMVVAHTINFQSIADRAARKSELLLELRRVLIELGVSYHLLPQEVNVVTK